VSKIVFNSIPEVNRDLQKKGNLLKATSTTTGTPEARRLSPAA